MLDAHRHEYAPASSQRALVAHRNPLGQKEIRIKLKILMRAEIIIE